MATYENVIPKVLIQKFKSGDSCTGVAFSGSDTGVRDPGGDSPLAGIIHMDRSAPLDGAIDGGLFDLGSIFPSGYFPQLTTIWINLPNTTVSVSAVDEDGVEFQIASVSSSQLVETYLDSWVCLPGWKIKVTATGGALTADGVIYLVFHEWTKPLKNSSLISHI